MKNEQIIANIEKYVATLDAEKQKEFRFLLEGAERNRTPVKKMYANVDGLIELAEIVQELKAEMKEKELKAKNGDSFAKRNKLVNKLLTKGFDHRFRNAFYKEINGEKLQCCVIEGIYAFMFRNELDLPINQASECDLARILPKYKDFEICDFDMVEIRTALKLHNAKKDKPRCLIELNGTYFDAKHFINVIEGLGGNITMYRNPKTINASVFESENGIALLMPCRPPEK